MTAVVNITCAQQSIIEKPMSPSATISPSSPAHLTLTSPSQSYSAMTVHHSPLMPSHKVDQVITSSVTHVQQYNTQQSSILHISTHTPNITSSKLAQATFPAATTAISGEGKLNNN